MNANLTMVQIAAQYGVTPMVVATVELAMSGPLLPSELKDIRCAEATGLARATTNPYRWEVTVMGAGAVEAMRS